MITLNRTEDRITGAVNGEQFSVDFNEAKYNQMRELEVRANSATDMTELMAAVEEFKILAKESYKEKIETASEYIVGDKRNNRFYLKYGDRVGALPLPQTFVDKILKSTDKGIDVTPLIKCIVRFLRPVPGRPDRTTALLAKFAAYIDADYVDQSHVAKLMADDGLSHEVAEKKATTKQVSITQEGLLVCYKVSRELMDQFSLDADEEVVKKSKHGKSIDPDTGAVTYNKAQFSEDRVFEPYVMSQRGDAFMCDNLGGTAVLGHKIKVGHSIYLDSWDKVSSPGNKGLHCGGLNYIKGYQKDDSVTHNILVDPMDIYDISSVHGIGNDGAMTVRRYFVWSTFESVNRNIYHSATYASITDAEYAKLAEEAVKGMEMKMAEARELLEFNKGLGTASATARGGHEAKSSNEVFGG